MNNLYCNTECFIALGMFFFVLGIGWIVRGITDYFINYFSKKKKEKENFK